MKKKKCFRTAAAAVLFAAAVTIVYLLYRYNYIPHRKYTNEDFGITACRSGRDADGDNIDDQTDILQSAKDYVATKPKYKSNYYAGGYPDDEYGVCTDVVAQALLGAGYDLRFLVDQDIRLHPDDYEMDKADDKIDFRRVKNLKVYFKNNATALTTDITEIDEWQGGDIVIFAGHVGIVSDSRNKKGIPFVIHNAHPLQASYEEDILETWGEIVGHYRIDSSAGCSSQQSGRSQRMLKT